jgi:ribosomal protein L30E
MDLRRERNFIGAKAVSHKRATSPDSRNRLEGTIMNITQTLATLLVLAAFGNNANAQLTREQVKAELTEAIRSGDMPAGGESDLKLNQMFPGRYPVKPALVGKTREQVRAELAEAIRTGDMAAGGESGQKLNETNPGRYPAKPLYAGKTREQVKAELAEAIRTGNMPAGGESGLMLYEMAPARYAKAREAIYANKPQVPAPTAAAAASAATAVR